MKKKIIIVCGILLAIICIAISFFIWINKDKTDYDKIYLNSLNFEGRLAEYTFKPKVNNDSGYKIKFKIKEELKDNTVVFAGPSGVGKSSLLNQIDSNFQLKTGDVSDKIKRGKHTTRHAELFELKFGGMVADTPGFSSLTLDDIEDIDLKDYFIEFEDYDDCKFGSRCIHQNEPNCAVKEAVENGEIPKERYESYIQLLNEIRQGKRRY